MRQGNSRTYLKDQLPNRKKKCRGANITKLIQAGYGDEYL